MKVIKMAARNVARQKRRALLLGGAVDAPAPKKTAPKGKQ